MPGPPVSDANEWSGEVVAGRYELRQRLGRGGMGEVYRAWDRSTSRELALKRVLARDAKSSNATIRFQREFHVMARLRHPNIVEVFDYGVGESGPYYTMELLDGEDLRALGPMKADRACEVLREVAAALTFLHSRHLLHRDMSARNIRCTSTRLAKLIDFGVLATFGVVNDIAGTPPLIAPENLRGLPLDQRADLFGFGGLAYWLLTGRHAFRVRALRELESAWQQAPPPPSELVEGVPAGLDDLVMSLLTIDPLGRPRSAVEVVDRLSGLFDMPPIEEDVVRGYVANAPMVGRRSELRRIRRHAARAVGGRGCLTLVEAPSGTGKSRLLREVIFEAQLLGATVASVDCGAVSRGPYGALRALAESLIESAPEETRSAAKESHSLLARVVPSLAGPVEDDDEAEISDPAEVRLRVQGAIFDWFRSVSEERPLAILIDDVQRCDEASLAAFAALSRSAPRLPILLVAAVRTDEEAQFPRAIAQLVDVAERMELTGLTREDTEELVRSIFGEVPRTAYLAQWMHDKTGGSPLHLNELARFVVSRGIVTFHDGMWVLPGKFAEKEVPAALEGALEARLAPLSDRGRALGEALGIHGGELTLELALALSGQSHETVFSAIDDLVQQQVLVGTGDRYRFRHDGLREALVRGLDPERKKALHIRVAEVLSERGVEGADRMVEVGWHYHRGGEELRGARLLEEAGRALFDAQAMGDALAPLETALRTYREAGASQTDHLDLQFMLIVGGALSDRDTALRHVDTTLTAYQRQSGVALAIRIGRVLGRHVGLLAGVGIAMLRWLVTPGRARRPNPMVAVTRYMLTIGHASYIYFATNDVDGFRSLMRWMAPMNAFRGLGPHGAYNGQLGMLDILLGRLAEAKRRLTIAADSIMVDRITPTTEFERRLIEAASRGFLVLAGVFQLDPDVDAQLERIEELDLRYFDFGAKTAKAIRLRLNGMEREALAITREQESTALQLGAGWHLEAMLITYSSLAYALCRDMLGLKRCVEDLTRLVDAGFSFRPQLAWASGEYLRERGELDEARRRLTEALGLLDEEENTIRQWSMAALAEVALAAGDHREAKELAEEGLAFSSRHDVGQVLPRLKVTRVLALAEAGLGEVELAAARLDDAIRDADELDNPPLLAALHEAQARIAYARGDRLLYERHRLELVSAVERTQNPALIAIAERVKALDRPEAKADAGAEGILEGAAMTIATAVEGAASKLAECRGPAERAARVLELAVRSSTGRSGFLFVLADDALVLAAPAHASVPPEAEDAVSAAVELTVKNEARTTTDAHQTESPVSKIYEVSPLSFTESGVLLVVGAVAIVPGSLAYHPPNPRLLEQLARELYRAGDVSTGVPTGDDP